MFLPFRRYAPLIVLFVLSAGLLDGGQPTAFAGRAVLKNKTVIEGEIVPIKGLTPALIARSSGPTETYNIIMIHTGYKRYFVPRRQMDWDNSDLTPNTGSPEFFDFKRRLPGRKLGWSLLGSVRNATPWSKFGRRRVEVWTSIGGKKGWHPIVQGVTKITPKYLEVEGINFRWKHGIAVTSVPKGELRAMIYQIIKPKDPSDRMSVVRFYIQAGMYQDASRELVKLVVDFPDHKKKAKEVRFELRQLTAKQIISELRSRKKAGQHRLVYLSCVRFPRKDITGSVLKEMTTLKSEYDTAKTKMGRALALLVGLESKLKNAKTLKAVKPMRSEIRSKLDVDSLPRLDAFLKLADDATLTPTAKLALAYSGWILGSGNANTNLDLTVRQWEARFLVIEFLRTESAARRKELLATIRRIEGVKPQHLGFLVPFLPPLVATPSIKAGVPTLLKVAGREAKPAINYVVQLPLEYNPQHVYPAIVALRPQERSARTELTWWGGDETRRGQAQRHGYIVIAPEYAVGKAGGYDYSSQAHSIVIHCLRDARKRFSIDSDRVFLSGHGSGGDAAFDIGMSHPDLFAGVLPVVGIMDKFCRAYYLNAKHLPWYIVSGELARHSLTRNARLLSKMMIKSPIFDVTYAEYIGRGYESYYEEIHRMFDWMSLHRRRKYPKRIEARILRVSDDRFWWIKGEGFPKNVTRSTVLVPGVRKTFPMRFEARVNVANHINILSGATFHTLWLSPEFIDYGKRMEVRSRGRKVFSGFLTREIGTMLDDLRIRGDRQKLYWTKLQVGRRLKIRK